MIHKRAMTSSSSSSNPIHTSSISTDEEDENAPFPPHSHVSNQLKRSLTFYDGCGIVIGIMIGSGIFSSPGLAMERAGSAGLVLFAWVSAGALVANTILTYSELAAMIPTAGGDFDYLKRAYGDKAAFAFAWFNFWVSKPGSQAIIARVCADYLVAILYGDLNQSSNNDHEMGSKAIAAVLIAILTLINCLGVRESANVQNILTLLKLILIGIVALMAVYHAFDDNTVLYQNLSIENSFTGSKGFAGFFTALVACLWAFDGWADINFLAEELLNPERMLPLVMLAAVSVVTLCYVSLAIAYLAVLDGQVVMSSQAIAIDFGRHLSSGSALAAILAFGVVVSAAGSCNGSIMTGGRAFYAVARLGFAPRVLSQVNSMGAPYTSLLAQGAWGIVLLLLPGSSFGSLLNYFGPTSWLFYAFTSSGVMVLRYKEPNLPRPFRIPLYPLPPLITFMSSACIVYSSLATEPLYCGLALCFVFLSYPVWEIKRYIHPDRVKSDDNGIRGPTTATNNIGGFEFAAVAQREV